VGLVKLISPHGSVVVVDEEFAARLGAQYRPFSEVPEGDPGESWTVAQLRAFAEANGIDIAGATKKDDILAAVVK